MRQWLVLLAAAMILFITGCSSSSKPVVEIPATSPFLIDLYDMNQVDQDPIVPYYSGSYHAKIGASLWVNPILNSSTPVGYNKTGARIEETGSPKILTPIKDGFAAPTAGTTEITVTLNNGGGGEITQNVRLIVQ
jgi:hypothetical protein